MSRDHCKGGVVQFVCTDIRHQDSDEYRRLGYHRVRTLRLAERADGTLALFWEGLGPVKDYRRDDGELVFRFECKCGRDVQRGESDLVAIVARYTAAFPGKRPEPDITRLERQRI